MKCKWTDPKGANCEPKMVEDLHIYKVKFGAETIVMHFKMTWGDFVASDGKSFYIQRITFDEKFWEQRIEEP